MSTNTVKVVHEDNETSPQAAVQAARKLVDSDNASCITGAWASADTIPTAQSVAIPDGVLLISPASTSDEITGLDDNGLVNRTSPAGLVPGPDARQHDRGRDRWCRGQDGEHRRSERRLWHRSGRRPSATPGRPWAARVGEQVIYDPEQPSYDSEAEQITSGNPDATVIIDFPENFPKVAPALQRTGNWDPTKGWFTDGLASSSLPEDVATQIIDGMRGTAPGSPDKGEASTAFDELYTSSDPKDVDRQTFDAQNFDATILCYLSAVAAGSTDGKDMADQLVDVSAPPGTPYTWEQLPEAIKALQNGDDIDYQGASGAIDMDDAGDATAGVYDIYTFKGARPRSDRGGARGQPQPVVEVRASREARERSGRGASPGRFTSSGCSGARSIRAVPPR